MTPCDVHHLILLPFFKTTYDCTVDILLHPSPHSTEKCRFLGDFLFSDGLVCVSVCVPCLMPVKRDCMAFVIDPFQM